MLTEHGPVLLECNARFGDPETQAVLPRLAVALGPLLLAAARGALPQALAAAGMADLTMVPDHPGCVRRGRARGGRLSGSAPARGPDPRDSTTPARPAPLVFHAGTSRQADGTWRTAGGRVLSVVGQGIDAECAHDAAEIAAGAIAFDGLQRRHDIGLSDASVAAASGADR